MSRTIRKNSPFRRSPKTQNELRQIKNLLADLKNEDYSISGINHLHRRLNLPDLDSNCSAYYEN